MKGVVLAGGTATRLFPLTIVTNKHLLPIYDRPMIYYPIETLAGMGIREVLVIVGGKSVGDVVELLADGSHFGLDLTYRYQRGALGIAHAIGLVRDFVGDESFCVVLGDNILRGAALEPVAREFEAGDWGAGTLLYRVPDPERFGVAELDADGRVVGFEEKPAIPKSDLIPIGVYFLRPDAFDVIGRLAPSGRGEFEITDVLNHYIPGHRLFTRIYDGHWTDAGTVPSLLRAAELAASDDEAGRLHPPAQRPDDSKPAPSEAALASVAAPGAHVGAPAVLPAAAPDASRSPIAPRAGTP
jgi:glucose-1-phosphate thymidylyltransferase